MTLRHLALLLVLALHAAAADIVFPPNSGVLNVREAHFGAKGDGVTDDTEALRKVFKACEGTHMATAYLPAGTYVVSDTLRFAEWIYVQGESRARTVIRLKDGATGFQNAAQPKPLVSTLSPTAKGQMNMNFSTHLLHVTLDTGRGNAGAVGVEFMSHNGGGLEEVTIRSGDGAGAIGIDMRRGGQGPALCTRVSVEGFDVGIEAHPSVYSSVFDELRLSGQRQAGIRIKNHPLTVRRLVSENRVPVMQAVPGDEGGQFVLVDSELRGGAADAVAIDNTAKSKFGETHLFLRNVKVAGYRAAADDRGRAVTAQEAAAEYHSGKVLSLGEGAARSLALPVRDVPELPWEAPAAWKNVLDFGAVKLDAATRQPGDKMWDKPIEGHDITEALQKAVDSGAATVFLPRGNYLIRRPVRLRGKLRVLQGCGSIVIGARAGLAGEPMFIVEGAGEPLFLDRISFGDSEGKVPFTKLEHAAARPLVIQHSRWLGYRNAAPIGGGALGDLFVDDMCGGPWLFAQPQNAWLRSLNVESDKTKVTNRAATLWVLGYKTEGKGTDFILGPGSATEILGGSIYEGHSTDVPCFLNEGGRLSATLARFWTREVLLRDPRRGAAGEIKTGKGARHVDLLVAAP